MKQIENINREIKGLRIVLSPYKIEKHYPKELEGFVEGSGQFGFFVDYNGEIIGFVSIGDPFKTRKKHLSISYIILEKFRKQHFAYESIFYLLDELMAKGLKYYNSAQKEIYLRPKSLYILAKEDNIASRKVAEKLGFKFEKEVEFSDGANSAYILDVDKYYCEWEDSFGFIDKKIELAALVRK